jgi:hypothetical protein
LKNCLQSTYLLLYYYYYYNAITDYVRHTHIHNKLNVMFDATADKFAHANSRQPSDSEMLQRVQHCLQKMQLSGLFIVAETPG